MVFYVFLLFKWPAITKPFTLLIYYTQRCFFIALMANEIFSGTGCIKTGTYANIQKITKRNIGSIDLHHAPGKFARQIGGGCFIYNYIINQCTGNYIETKIPSVRLGTGKRGAVDEHVIITIAYATN